MTVGDATAAGDVSEKGVKETVGLEDVDIGGMVDVSAGEGDEMPFASATSVFLLDGKTGMNATAHSRNKTGPNIFSPLFA
jgi:hypothetical protein